MAIGLLLVAAAVAPLARYELDPERVPKDNLAELERHRPVILIGQTGGPRWSRWPAGADLPLKAPERDGTFTLNTLEYRLLELMPRLPANGYRYSAEIMHRDGVGLGQVGLYFAGSSQKNDAGEDELTCCTLTFDDWAIQPIGPERKAGLLNLRGRRWNPATDFSAETIALIHHPFQTGAERRPRPYDWRRLAIEVRPDQFEAFWDEQSVGVVPREEMDREFQRLNALLKLKHGKPPLHPLFLPEQGLGLYLINGTASFRNVRIEPL